MLTAYDWITSSVNSQAEVILLVYMNFIQIVMNTLSLLSNQLRGLEINCLLFNDYLMSCCKAKLFSQAVNFCFSPVEF